MTILLPILIILCLRVCLWVVWVTRVFSRLSTAVYNFSYCISERCLFWGRTYSCVSSKYKAIYVLDTPWMTVELSICSCWSSIPSWTRMEEAWAGPLLWRSVLKLVLEQTGGSTGAQAWEMATASLSSLLSSHFLFFLCPNCFCRTIVSQGVNRVFCFKKGQNY